MLCAASFECKPFAVSQLLPLVTAAGLLDVVVRSVAVAVVVVEAVVETLIKFSMEDFCESVRSHKFDASS